MLKLFSCRATSKGLFPVGKLTQSGAEIKFGSRGSWIGLHTDGEMQRVLVRVKGQTFGLSIQKTNAWIILEADDAAPHVYVALGGGIQMLDTRIKPTAWPRSVQSVRLRLSAPSATACRRSARGFDQHRSCRAVACSTVGVLQLCMNFVP